MFPRSKPAMVVRFARVRGHGDVPAETRATFIPPLRAQVNLHGEVFLVVGHRCLIHSEGPDETIVLLEGVDRSGKFPEWTWYHPDEVGAQS